MKPKSKSRTDAAARLKRQKKTDNYYNQFSGFGGANDPVNRAVLKSPVSLSQRDVDDQYASSWIFRRAIDVLVEDSLREWVDLKTEDKDLISDINSKVKSLKAVKKTMEALRLARMYGGSVLVIGAVDGGEAEEELKEDSITEIAFLQPIDRWQLVIDSKYNDPLKPNYGEPEIYSINPLHGENTGSKIHASRVIRFDGVYLPPRKKIQNQGWHDSVYVGIVDDIKNFILSNQTAGQLLQDFITKVLEMPNLTELIENERFNSIEARIQYALAAMSNVGLSLIQGGEDGEKFSKIQTPITGFVELMDKMQDMVSAAIGVPKVKLFGQQPGKLSGLDETIRIYHDEVSAYQETELHDKLERLYSLLLKSKENKKGEPDKWDIEFNPLRIPTDKEQSETQKTQSEADKNYVEMGILSAEEVAESRFTDDGFKLDTTIDMESRGEMKEIEEEEDGTGE
jgi:phage-related protein (TIGR01555 family)